MYTQPVKSACVHIYIHICQSPPRKSWRTISAIFFALLYTRLLDYSMTLSFYCSWKPSTVISETGISFRILRLETELSRKTSLKSCRRQHAKMGKLRAASNSAFPCGHQESMGIFKERPLSHVSLDIRGLINIGILHSGSKA